jgi:hypothetical protein
VIELTWSPAADPELAEREIPKGLTEGREALVQQLFAVSDEHEARSRKSRAQARVVQRSHDGFPRSRRRDEEIAMVTPLARDGDLLE